MEGIRMILTILMLALGLSQQNEISVPLSTECSKMKGQQMGPRGSGLHPTPPTPTFFSWWAPLHKQHKGHVSACSKYYLQICVWWLSQIWWDFFNKYDAIIGIITLGLTVKSSKFTPKYSYSLQCLSPVPSGLHKIISPGWPANLCVNTISPLSI